MAAKKEVNDEPMIKTALFLTQQHVADLKGLQTVFPGIPLSEHVRRAIGLYLIEMEKVAKKMPTLPGADYQ